MPPGNVQVVLVGEPCPFAQLQCRKRHLGRSGGEFPRAVARGTQAELIEVDALPPHRDLDGAVQLAQGAGVRYQHPPPYHRADAEQPDLDLYNRFRIRQRQRRFTAGSGSLRGSRHPVSLSPIAPPVASTPQILMLSLLKRQSRRSRGRRPSNASPDHNALSRRRSRPRNRPAVRTQIDVASRPADGDRSCQCACQPEYRQPCRSGTARRPARGKRAVRHRR